jgi:hypothetical protein
VSSRLVIVLALLVLAGIVVWLLWLAWRSRQTDFIHRVAVGGSSDAVATHVFDRILPSLVKDGYQMVAQAGNTTVFEHRFMYGWTFVVALVFFPFGLLALLLRGRDTIVVIGGSGAVEVNGTCPKPIADWIIAVLDEGAALAAEVSQA